MRISLNNLNNYFIKWKIKVNENKTQSIFFTRRRATRYLPNRNITLANTEIEWSPEIKYLGMILDKKLTFKNHCTYSNERAQKYIRILYPLINRKSTLNIHNKRLIIKCIFLPMLLYAGQVWGKCAPTHIKPLQITQNKLLKLIYNLPYYYSTELLHTNSNFLKIEHTLNNMLHKFESSCQHSDNPLINTLYPTT